MNFSSFMNSINSFHSFLSIINENLFFSSLFVTIRHISVTNIETNKNDAYQPIGK